MNSLDRETNSFVEQKFSLCILKYNHILEFLNVCAQKGQVGFVKVNIETLNNHLYWNIVDEIFKAQKEFDPIREVVQEKVELMIEQKVGIYFERAITVSMSNL